MNNALISINAHLNVQIEHIDRLLKGSEYLWHLLQDSLGVHPIYMIIKEVGHIEAYKLFPEKYIQECSKNVDFTQPIIRFQSICREWLMFRGCVKCFNIVKRVEQSTNTVDIPVSYGEGDGWICISCGKFHLN